MSVDAAIDKLKNWQSVNSAPDYKMRVRELDDDEDRDVPQQRYCFELSIPMKENGKKIRQQQYDYSGAMIGKLKPEERENYKNEIDGYIRAGYWQDLEVSPLPRRYNCAISDLLPVVVFPVKQEGRHTRIRPCADARGANEQSPRASYRGGCISSILQHIMIGWREGFCVHTRDVKKAFYK
ncbi:hypothetical protein Pmar_PMAR015691, partial [Perkinsus marinus ATCC 50983]